MAKNMLELQVAHIKKFYNMSTDGETTLGKKQLKHTFVMNAMAANLNIHLC